TSGAVVGERVFKIGGGHVGRGGDRKGDRWEPIAQDLARVAVDQAGWALELRADVGSPSRVDLDSVWHALHRLGHDQSRAVARERIEHRVAGARKLAQKMRHQLLSVAQIFVL